MNIIQSIILGIVQGVTEFIPVSSSGHLVLVREFLGWEDPGISFDIALHCGTLFALLFYFRKLWQRILKEGQEVFHKRLLWGIVIATLPAVVLGYFGQGLIIRYFRFGISVGIWMVAVGALFVLIEKLYSDKSAVRSKDVLSWWDYLLIGIAQSVALVPGISRSGMTIVAGMNRKMSRRQSAEFSFLLAIPVIFGAAIYDFLANYQALSIDYWQTALGFLMAAIAGYLSLRLLMNYLSRHRLNIFAYYLFTLGIITIVFSLWRIK